MRVSWGAPTSFDAHRLAWFPLYHLKLQFATQTHTVNIYKACKASQQKNNLNSSPEELGKAVLPSGDEAQSHRGVLRDIIENTSKPGGPEAEKLGL